MMSAIKHEKQWVIQMKDIILTKNSENNIANPVCIYQVSKSIRDTKPEAYTPQVVALGPYHHLQPKTYHMQRYKVNAALKAHDNFKLLELPQLFEKLKESASDIRESYHEHLDIEDETLMWMMLIDGLFLLSLMEKEAEASSEIDQFVDSSGRKHSLEAILKDALLLENQVPKVALDALMTDNDNAGALCFKLVKFCSFFTPVKLWGDFPHTEMISCQHVLDVLHQLVWLGTQIKHKEEDEDEDECYLKMPPQETFSSGNLIFTLLPLINIGFVTVFVAILDLFRNISNVVGVFSLRNVFVEEKFLIPSATKLASVGVKFCVNGIRDGIRDNVSFGSGIQSLHLPVLNLHGNLNFTEVVMRNLLAYEAAAMPDSPKFTRFVELMSGLMPTISDVELLQNVGYSTSDDIVPKEANAEGVVKLFRSLKEAIGSKGESELDTTIENVNKYYNNCRKVKIRKFMKKYLFVSKTALTVLALILILALLVMQTFCSIYSCPRIFNTK